MVWEGPEEDGAERLPGLRAGKSPGTCEGWQNHTVSEFVVAVLPIEYQMATLNYLNLKP